MSRLILNCTYVAAQGGITMCKVTLLERRHLVDASDDEYHYTQTEAQQGCMKHKLIAQQTKEKDWQAEATPHEQIPKQKRQEIDPLRQKREGLPS